MAPVVKLESRVRDVYKRQGQLLREAQVTQYDQACVRDRRRGFISGQGYYRGLAGPSAQVLSLIHISQAAAIDVMAQNIFWNSDSKVERILAFDIPEMCIRDRMSPNGAVRVFAPPHSCMRNVNTIG